MKKAPFHVLKEWHIHPWRSWLLGLFLVNMLQRDINRVQHCWSKQHEPSPLTPLPTQRSLGPHVCLTWLTRSIQGSDFAELFGPCQSSGGNIQFMQGKVCTLEGEKPSQWLLNLQSKSLSGWWRSSLGNCLKTGGFYANACQSSESQVCTWAPWK